MKPHTQLLKQHHYQISKYSKINGFLLVPQAFMNWSHWPGSFSLVRQSGMNRPNKEKSLSELLRTHPNHGEANETAKTPSTFYLLSVKTAELPGIPSYQERVFRTNIYGNFPRIPYNLRKDYWIFPRTGKNPTSLTQPLPDLAKFYHSPPTDRVLKQFTITQVFNKDCTIHQETTSTSYSKEKLLTFRHCEGALQELIKIEAGRRHQSTIVRGLLSLILNQEGRELSQRSFLISLQLSEK